MNAEKYSQKDKEEIIKAFKVFLQKIVKHSAIDFARKVKSAKYREIVYSDLINYEMSLSDYDDGIFFIEENGELEDKITDNKLKNVLKLLTKKEKEVLSLYAEGYSVREISKIMKITEQAVKNYKARAKRKIIGGIKKW